MWKKDKASNKLLKSNEETWTHHAISPDDWIRRIFHHFIAHDNFSWDSLMHFLIQPDDNQR